MILSTVHRFVGTDPWQNLAREELWLDRLAPGSSALVLYVNGPSIVLGKHQNPLAEVRLAEAARRSIPLVRRASGGGTVWHDEGNLNWSVLVPKDGYRRAAVPEAVARALEPLGFTLEVGEKGDLFWKGRKVSGAASLVRRDRVLHHGTLLCRARLEDLRGVLGPTGTLTESVGVASRPSPVANLGIDVDRAVAALTSALAPGIPVGDGTGDETFEAGVAALARGRAGPDWLWDQTPPFTWEGEGRHGPLKVRVVDGIIERDDTSMNMSKILGKRFFDPQILEYIPTGEAL